MSPYTVFPTFSFLERVYNDGFRIIIYKAVKVVNKTITHKLFPYEAIFEENSYVKFHTAQNPSNYVLYYDTKYILGPECDFERIDTIKNNSSLVKCRVYDFNINDIKIDLLKVNNFDIRQISGTMDDLWVGVFFDRNGDNIKYDLCRYAPNDRIVRASKSIYTKINETKYMHVNEQSKFAVRLEYVDAFEYFKYGTDSLKYMEMKKGVNRLFIKRDTADWFCDDKTKLAKLVKYGLPLEFAYKASTIDNMVFIIEDIYRTYRDNTIFGPIYKTYID